MQLQVAGLCLGEHEFQQIMIKPTAGRRQDLDARRKGIKEYVRDELTRRVKKLYGSPPWFLFAIEDADLDGETTDPHIHGSVLIKPLPLPVTRSGELRVRWRRIASEKGVAFAELEYSRKQLLRELQAIAGEGAGRAHRWAKRPYGTRSNPSYISYLMKNMHSASTDVPERRIAISRPLNQEARRLWDLIRFGESALASWA